MSRLQISRCETREGERGKTFVLPREWRGDVSTLYRPGSFSRKIAELLVVRTRIYVYRVAHPVRHLVWVDFELDAPCMLRQFCPFSVCPSRIAQTVEQPKQSLPNHVSDRTNNPVCMAGRTRHMHARARLTARDPSRDCFIYYSFLFIIH